MYSIQDDLHGVKAAVKSDLRHVETELKREFADIKSDLKQIKWMLGVVVAGILALLMKAFLHG